MPNKVVKVSITIPRNLKEALDREAKQQNRSFSNMVAHLLDKQVKPVEVVRRSGRDG